MIDYQAIAHNALISLGFNLNLMAYSRVHKQCYEGRVTVPQIKQGYLDVVFGYDAAPFFSSPSIYIKSRPAPLDQFWPNIEEPIDGLYKLCIFDNATHKLEPYAIEAVIEAYIKRVKDIVARSTKQRVDSFSSEVSSYFRNDISGYYAKHSSESVLSVKLYLADIADVRPSSLGKSAKGSIDHLTDGAYSPVPTLVTNIDEIKATPKDKQGLNNLIGMIDVIRGSNKITLAVLKQKLQSFLNNEKEEIERFFGFALAFHFQGNIYAYVFKFAKGQLKQIQNRTKVFIERLLRGQLKVAEGKFAGELKSITKVHLSNGSNHALIERNYSNNLINKQICIIGAGTLGSYLAHVLVKHGAGIDKPLYIYDKDVVLPENLSRHFLGSESLFKNKALGLVQAIKTAAPDRTFIAKEDFLLDLGNIPAGTDIVIDATGDFNTAMTLNHQVKLYKPDYKIYHAYLCGGGQSARLFLQGSGGCYRCLFDKHHKHVDKEFKKNNVQISITRNCGQSNVQFPVDSSVGAASFIASVILETGSLDNPISQLFFKVLGKEAMEHKNRKVERSSACPACGTLQNE